MDFGPSRCFTMNVTREKKSLITDYMLNGTILDNTENSTYLDVTIRKGLKWSDHVNRISSKAKTTLGLLLVTYY